MTKKIRVLHCPTTVGGNPQGLAEAERRLGINSYSIAFRQNYLQYKADEVLINSDTGGFLRTLHKRFKLIQRAINDYDIIHFNFGQSILPHRINCQTFTGFKYLQAHIFNIFARLTEQKDLPRLKKAGKKIIVTYQGDDARQGSIIKQFPINIQQHVPQSYYSEQSDQFKRQQIQVFDKYADAIFSVNPDLLHVLPQRTQFIPYSHIFLDEWTSNPPQITNTPPLIIHAPSHRGVKGTKYILQAIEQLKKDNIPFRFELIEGLSHNEAKKLYEKADLLIDQLFAGWYGGLSVELMALGKPVMCYIREDDLKFIPAQMAEELPIINVNQQTLTTELKKWLTTNKKQLTTQGQKGRKYVEQWHDPLKIAKQMKSLYEQLLSEK